MAPLRFRKYGEVTLFEWGGASGSNARHGSIVRAMMGTMNRRHREYDDDDWHDDHRRLREDDNDDALRRAGD